VVEGENYFPHTYTTRTVELQL